MPRSAAARSSRVAATRTTEVPREKTTWDEVIWRRCATRTTGAGRRRSARSARPPSAPPRGKRRRGSADRPGLTPLVRGGFLVRHPGGAEPVAGRVDVVLLDLLGVLPRLPPADREDLVDLARVVRPMPGDHRDDLAERGLPTPVHGSHAREVGRLGDVVPPPGGAPLEPPEDVVEVLL